MAGCSLDRSEDVDRLLDGVDVVLPRRTLFSNVPSDGGCVFADETHYLDITGEMGVFREVFSRSEEAREAGVVLIPGAVRCRADRLHGCDVQ